MRPPENLSPEAVALREAALDWGQYLHDYPLDDNDRAGQRRNRRLLSAALRYAARVVSGLTVAEIKTFRAASVPEWVAWCRKNGHQIAAAIRSYTGSR